MAIQGETRQKPRSRIREPKRYQVIMHNDDYTPMDFVVKILMEVFHKGKEEAVALMMYIRAARRRWAVTLMILPYRRSGS